MRLSSGAVHLVAGVAPGDRVEIAIDPGDRRKKGGARLVRVVEPSVDRVAPSCPIATACGGCDWMFLSAAAQAREHARVVRDLLAHALGHAAPEPTVHAAAAPLGYRTRARLHVDARGRRIRVGYHEPRSRELVEPDACLVLEPGLFEAVPARRSTRGVYDRVGATGRGPGARRRSRVCGRRPQPGAGRDRRRDRAR